MQKATNAIKNNSRQTDEDYQSLVKLVASKKEKLQVTTKEISKIKKEVKVIEKEYEGFK